MDAYQLYHADSYLREMDATVLRVEENWAILDQTVFYAQSGGQPADHGTLSWATNQAGVIDVRRHGAEIWHRLEGAMPEVEARVHGQLDWDRRYALMRTHTALHILCGVIWRDYGAHVTSSSMDPLKGRQDFELERMTLDFVTEIEQRVNAEITANREVCIRFLPRAEAFTIPDLIRTKINLLPPDIEQVRVAEIVGLDLQADGGTHVARTCEVGHIRVVGHESKGRINKRIRIAIED
ncbi:alanyl-tRNA editing protein [Ktedonosporobacter rubrisoli]|uniref:Alanyl-tRNA editing protein n=1 Tax=Ktedonosporobacter rubrisoli TaxID=2509675 RepID=A0A4P6JPA5_KTERU|nr:alanyl-tRNA editing protein [Ktedonosporobacter rubrisoli]QBD77074.1 alanyl-tRNA editing protein [Ktedonosporobacter rubrisoli]